MLKLKVSVDTDSGFCFGVIYAVQMAEELLQEHHHLYCLGDIVHNDEEVERLKGMGLKIISHEDLKELKNERILIRAHGEPSSTYKIAAENNLEIIDASCPVVLKLQNRIRNSYNKKDPVYIYGKRGHAEVVGLQSQTGNEAIVFESLEELDVRSLPKKISLFSQTTKGTGQYYKIYEKLMESGIDVDFNDTICRQVSNRDSELQKFAARFDVILFVSGKKSSNGKVLFEVCKRINSRTYFVSSVNDIDTTWFASGESIGICGATSTPMWLMEKIKDCLEII